MILPLAVSYALVGRVKPLTRILLGYCCLVIMTGIVLTFSRGGWAAAAIGILALLGALILNHHHRLTATLLSLLFIGGGAWVGSQYVTRTASYVQRSHAGGMEPGQIELELRSDLWNAAVQMWRDNFWFGAGPAHYNYRYPQYRTERVQLTADRAHNDYLNLLADWGTTGGVIVLSGITAFIIGLLQTRKHVHRAEKTFGSGMSNRHAFFLGAAAGLLALAAHSVVDFNLHIPANAILGVTLLALAGSNLRFATEKFWVNIRLPLKISISILLVAGVFYLGLQEVCRAREQGWLDRAAQAPNFSPERAAALEKAFAAEPENFQTAYALGECYRTQSFDGGKDSERLAQTAMDWYSRGMKLNRFDGYNFFRYGMCLDWLGRHPEAEAFFWDAEALDPNGYFTAAHFGWHYFQAGDYAAARPWLIRSLRLAPHGNSIAQSYLELTEQKLRDQASGKILFPGF